MTSYWIVSNLLFVASFIAYLFLIYQVKIAKLENDPAIIGKWVRLSRLALVIWIVLFIAMIATIFI